MFLVYGDKFVTFVMNAVVYLMLGVFIFAVVGIGVATKQARADKIRYDWVVRDKLGGVWLSDNKPDNHLNRVYFKEVGTGLDITVYNPESVEKVMAEASEGE